MSQLRDQIKKHEGLRLKPYRCSAGKLTIGYGRNLEDTGITTLEAEYLLDKDIARCLRHAQTFKFFWQLDDARQDVLIEMIFQLGITGFQTFKRLIDALDDGDWDRAADEMLQSKWREQTGKRAERLARMMRSGAYPKE